MFSLWCLAWVYRVFEKMQEDLLEQDFRIHAKTNQGRCYTGSLVGIFSGFLGVLALVPRLEDEAMKHAIVDGRDRK